MSKLILAGVMLAWGIVLMAALDQYQYITGTIWVVGAILLAWMPESKHS